MGLRGVVAHALLTLLLLASIVLFGQYWFSRGDFSRTPVVFSMMTMLLGVALLMYLPRWLCLPLMRRPVHRPPREGWRVAVATTFVPTAEPLDMLERSVAAMVALDYPHDTWVLDEGDDPAVRALCARLGARHFTRHGSPAYQTAGGRFERRTKHGNYNAWLDAVGYGRYDIMVNFDPDHVPASDFLLRTLGYFDDEQVGYVQAAQAYYNQSASFIARGAAEESYAYYSSVQMTAYALGYPIVTGCHTAQRMDALATVGGFAAHEADDMLITINYRVAGWGGVYVPEIVALGLTPVDWDGYLTQQRRWARSVLDVKFRIYPHVARQLPPVERLTSLFQGLYYLHGLGIAVGLALLTYLLAAGSAPAVLSWRVLPYALLVFGSLQACEVFRQAFFLLPSERGLHWRAGLLRLAKWPVVLLALFEALRPRDWEYSITRKIGGASESRLLVVPHVFVIATLGVALVIGTTTEHQIEPAVLATAAIIALLSLLLVLSGMRTWPHPYDSRLDHRPLQ